MLFSLCDRPLCLTAVVRSADEYVYTPSADKLKASLASKHKRSMDAKKAEATASPSKKVAANDDRTAVYVSSSTDDPDVINPVEGCYAVTPDFKHPYTYKHCVVRRPCLGGASLSESCLVVLMRFLG
jgi:hypothetical protein